MMTTMIEKHVVQIIESERGWGTKVEDTRYFDTEKDAHAFCKDFNKDNPTDYVPDYYIIARYEGVKKFPQF